MSSLRNQASPEDQRNVIIATILVAVIMFVWMFYLGPTPAERAGVASEDSSAQAAQTEQTASADTATDAAASGRSASTAAADTTAPDTTAAGSRLSGDPVLAGAVRGEARNVVVETDHYTAVLSTKGGTLTRFTLKDYLEFNKEHPVQLIDTTSTGALALVFTTPNSRLVDTRNLYYTASVEQDTIRVTDEPVTVSFAAALGSGELRQSYTFQPDDFDVGFDIDQKNADSFSTRDGYEIVWDGGLPFSEGGTDTEQQHSGVFAYSGGEMEGVTVQSEDHQEKNLNGAISWMSVKNKYFTAVLLPDDPEQTLGADLIGDNQNQGEVLRHKKLEARMQMPAASASEPTDRFHLYMGPLYYNQLSSYERDLYEMVDYGWDFFEWMTRPLAIWLFIPMLSYMGGYLPYGVVVILMAVFVKMLVYPLTKSSYRSMAQMRELQPEMERIKEEYGDDAQKQQEEMMKLYRETGVNPLGGCLPMLLQYPIIIALYQFIPQSVQLRQKSFLWASDLSAPDIILNLPFEIPFYGDYVAGFTLLMGLSMVVTMRLQSTPGSAGGQAKVFMYMMPAVIFFIFNRFASALSLYYLFYNIVTAAQQKWINHQLDKEKEEEEKAKEESSTTENGRPTRFEMKEQERQSKKKKKEEDKGFFARLMEKAEEVQRQREQREN